MKYQYHVAQIDMATGKLFDVKDERVETRAINAAKRHTNHWPFKPDHKYIADVFFEGETYRVTPFPEPAPLPPLGAHLS